MGYLWRSSAHRHSVSLLQEAASIGIIGGADGPMAIYTTMKLAPHLLPQVSVAAYSYMALMPLIQPPIMKLLTSKEERKIMMKQPLCLPVGENCIPCSYGSYC